MEILKAIVHEVDKDRQGKAVLNTRNKVLPDSKDLRHLVEGIRNTYSKKTARAYGRFQADTDIYPFSQFLEKFLNEELNFVEFSLKSLDLLKSKMDSEPLSTGGYVLFVYYKHAGVGYLIVTILTDTMSTMIDPDTLDVSDTTHLDLARLRHIGRVDIESWSGDIDEERYLSFVKGQSSDKETANYFREFLGCTEFVEAKKQTGELVAAILDYANEIGVSDELKYQLKKEVHDYFSEKIKKGEPVYLEALSSRIEEIVPGGFIEFVNESDWMIADEIHLDKSEIRKLRRYSAKTSSISISFDASLLNKEVFYDLKKSELIIKKIPQDLKDQLDQEY